MSSHIVNILENIKHDIEHFMNVEDNVKDISDSNTYCANNITIAPAMPTNTLDGQDDDATFLTDCNGFGYPELAL